MGICCCLPDPQTNSADGDIQVTELFGVVSRLRKRARLDQNEFNNKQNQTLTLKAERLSLLAKARLSLPSFIRTFPLF
jgi:hypothetical protein